MPHDVLISHSSQDKTFADAACARLEQHGIRCWIAPRDLPAEQNKLSAISQAIEVCQIVVLVFSAAALASDEVEAQVTFAADCKKVLLPVKIENVDPSGGIRFLLAKTHWLDAMTAPVEKHLDQLAETVKFQLSREAVRTGKTITISVPVEGPGAPQTRIESSKIKLPGEELPSSKFVVNSEPDTIDPLLILKYLGMAFGVVVLVVMLVSIGHFAVSSYKKSQVADASQAALAARAALSHDAESDNHMREALIALDAAEAANMQGNPMMTGGYLRSAIGSLQATVSVYHGVRDLATAAATRAMRDLAQTESGPSTAVSNDIGLAQQDVQTALAGN